jgi:hypothetical protein
MKQFDKETDKKIEELVKKIEEKYPVEHHCIYYGGGVFLINAPQMLAILKCEILFINAGLTITAMAHYSNENILVNFDFAK